jgi:hypothetical protein
MVVRNHFKQIHNQTQINRQLTDMNLASHW